MARTQHEKETVERIKEFHKLGKIPTVKAHAALKECGVKDPEKTLAGEADKPDA